MDVFGQAMQSSGFLRDAAIAAAHALGVFEALARAGPARLDELAGRIGVPGRRRLEALLDALVALGVIACERSSPARRFSAAHTPPRPVVVADGWGLLADAIRHDRPLAIAQDGEALRRLHHHLASSGAAAAAELAEHLRGSSSLLDLGAGAGAYSRAFLSAYPAARATLVDAADVLALAAGWLGPLACRARLVAGDAADVDAGADHAAVVLANLLHLHGPAGCERLVAAAARAVAPGGIVVIKDLRVDDDRAGPLEGLLFALNMALYTEAGDVHTTEQLRGWLAGAGLVDVAELRLASSPDAIVVTARRPAAAAARAVAAAAPATASAGAAPGSFAAAGCAEPRAIAAIAADLDVRLAETARDAWQALVASGGARAGAGAPELAFPAALRWFLARAIAVERADAAAGDAAAGARADQLVRHYSEAMPRMRVAQLAGSDEPGATLFHHPLDWDRLPRLARALDRLFAVLADASVAAAPVLGAASAPEFRGQTPTLAALHARTHYGGFMPLLYGLPADLACMRARAAADGLDALATIDRYLTAPIVHELCHFAPSRTAIAPPHLDECIAGWLGVHVHPELAYPAGEHDDALYAAPWLAQVGQAIARAFGVTAVVRAHAAGDPAALPQAFVAAAAELGWRDWKARRTLHFLSDTFDPAPWVGLALSLGAGCSVDGATLASLAAAPLAALAPPDDPAFDQTIVEHALRAMCLTSTQVAGSFRTRSRLPDGSITVDARAGWISAPGGGDLDPVVPRYWLPPAVASRIIARGRPAIQLRLASLAAIPAVAAAICAGSPDLDGADVVLT